MITRPVDNHPFQSVLRARHLVIIGLASAAVMSMQFFHPGYYYKIIEHAVMVHRYVPVYMESFSEGMFLPGWSAADFKGYGSPIFLFYSPMFYFMTALAALTGAGIPLSASMVELIFLFIGGVGMYVLIRESNGELAGLIGALCYVLIPTRILDLYYTNTPAGRLALAWMPYLLYYTRSCVSGSGGRACLAGTAFSYAGLILTHLATAYIFTPYIIVYAFIVANRGRRVKCLVRVLAGLASGVCLSAFLFLPVVLMRSEIHIGLMVSREDYSVYRNFLFGSGPGSRIPGIAALIRLHAVTILAETAAVGAIYYISRRLKGSSPGRESSYFIGSVALCLFMMSSYSGPLWELLPGLSTWSFPYRLATVYALFLSATAGIAYGAVFQNRVAGRRAAAAATTLLIVMALYSCVLAARAEPLSATYVSSLRGKVDFAEYLPAGADTSALTLINDADPTLSSDDVFTSDIIEWGQSERIFRITTPNGALVRVKTFYFPGWRAWVDGSEVQIGVEEGTGAMLIDVPPDEHKVHLRFTNTPARTVGLIISLVTLILLLLPYGHIMARLRRA